jgi:hypothetical protein
VFYLICLTAMLVNSALYRLLASALPNLDIATAGGALRAPFLCPHPLSFPTLTVPCYPLILPW